MMLLAVRYWYVAVIAALLACVAVLNKSVDTARSEAVKQRVLSQQLATQLQVQNAAVEKLEAAGKAKREEALQRDKKAQVVQRAMQTQANRVVRRVVGPSCPDVEKAARDELKRFKNAIPATADTDTPATSNDGVCNDCDAGNG